MADKQIYQNTPAPKAAFAFAALVAGNVCIAFGPLLVRLSDTGPIATGFWRLALAVPVLAVIGYRAGFRIGAMPGRLLGLVLLAGFFFAVDIIVWHLGIFKTKLGNATLLANCASLLLAIYGIVLARKLPPPMQGAAIALAFAGAALLMGQSFELSPEHFEGDWLSLLAGLFYTFYLLAMIRVRESSESWSSLALASGSAALFLLPAAWFAGEQIWPGDWTPLIVLALSSQVLGQGFLTYALPHFSPLVIGLALLLQPALSALAGWVAFDEAMTPLDYLGGAMVMAALVLVRLAEGRAKA
ncbi:DMT family transporter [Sphingorhabdus sp.]|jgi:drug/metabolite transporter (DMT)-like permease|uniref:DMT family transporter n=1 Tax=Sphingorhabdus sp. TaxID=1902408 RepID=UPI0035B2DC3C|nr:DMT family transporter [Sphingomonadaceae bacterium]